MAKTEDDSVENFVLSTTRAMQNYKKFLEKKRNFSGRYLAVKTIDYGVGMLNSGLGETVTPKKAEKLFREQAKISLALASYCKIIHKSKSNSSLAKSTKKKKQ